MNNKAFIPFSMPNIHDYLGESTERIEERIFPYLINIDPITQPVKIGFIWFEQKNNRPFSKISSGKEFIINTLLALGKIKSVSGTLFEEVVYSGRSGVEIIISPTDNTYKCECEKRTCIVSTMPVTDKCLKDRHLIAKWRRINE